MHNYGKLETCHFRNPLFINKNSEIEYIIHKNHRHGSIPIYFNNNIDTSSSGTPKATCVQHKPKVHSLHFVDPYDHINHT